MLSLCMIVRDEEVLLEDALRSVQGVVDEIIVGVDSRTSDRTEEIAQDYHARTFHFDWSDSFAEARNLTLDKAKGDWILVLDADDRLLQEGRRVATQTPLMADESHLDVHGFAMLLQDEDMHGSVLNVSVVPPRLFRGSPDIRYQGRVHEVPRYLPDPLRTIVVPLSKPPHIRHFGLDPTLMELRDKVARNRRLLEIRLAENPKDATALYYLAVMESDAGNSQQAAWLADRALVYGQETLHRYAFPRLEALKENALVCQ